MPKYIKIEVNNAGIYFKKDISELSFKKPITTYQLANILRVLYGQRPYNTKKALENIHWSEYTREAIENVGQDIYHKLAEKSYIKIKNLAHIELVNGKKRNWSANEKEYQFSWWKMSNQENIQFFNKALKDFGIDTQRSFQSLYLEIYDYELSKLKTLVEHLENYSNDNKIKFNVMLTMIRNVYNYKKQTLEYEQALIDCSKDETLSAPKKVYFPGSHVNATISRNQKKYRVGRLSKNTQQCTIKKVNNSPLKKLTFDMEIIVPFLKTDIKNFCCSVLDGGYGIVEGVYELNQINKFGFEFLGKGDNNYYKSIDIKNRYSNGISENIFKQQ